MKKIIEIIGKLFKRKKELEKTNKNSIPEINWYKLVSKNARRNWELIQKNIEDYENERPFLFRNFK